MKPPLPVIKRKRYQFIEENERDSSIDELQLLASTFANLADADASKWLRSAATKVLATTATKDTIFLYPSSKGDEREIANEYWARTSS